MSFRKADNTTQASAWKVQASRASLNTSNPIREIIENMNLAENPSKKLIPLSIGDPTMFGNLKPCKEILDALHCANSSGKHYGYQAAAGLESAREAVAEYHYRCTGNKIRKQDVILASGCSHAIDMSICVLAHQGQNILIPRPGFPLYKTLTSVYGIQYKQYNLLADKNWSIDLKHLESLIDDNTAAIVINNPSNPCGSVFTRKHLLQILDLAERYKKPIISDEIYDKFVFSPKLYDNNLDNHSSTRYRSALIEQTDSNHLKGNRNGNVSLLLGSNLHQSRQSSASLNRNWRRNKDENRQPNVTKLAARHQDQSKLKNGKLYQFKQYEDSIFDAELTQEFEYDGEIQIQDSISDSNSSRKKQQQAIDEQATGGNDSDDEVEDDVSHYVPFISLSSLSETVPILTCGGISKTCLIPGLRLGWIIINDKQNIFDSSVRNGLSRLTQRLMGPNSIVQGALHDILMTVPESFYTQTMNFIYMNAKLCYERLSLIQGLHPTMPQGSMYLMVRFDARSFPNIDGDLDFTSKLMNEESVLVLPGKCFDFPNYFRLCLTVPTHVMEEALDRIADFCKRYYKSTCNGSSDKVKISNHIQAAHSVDTSLITLKVKQN